MDLKEEMMALLVIDDLVHTICQMCQCQDELLSCSSDGANDMVIRREGPSGK